jgi:hypothetical protein
VLAAVDFDDELALEADEIQDVVAEWNLLVKFHSGKAATAKRMPDDGFRIGGVATHSPCMTADYIRYGAVLRAAGHYLSPGSTFG